VFVVDAEGYGRSIGRARDQVRRDPSTQYSSHLAGGCAELRLRAPLYMQSTGSILRCTEPTARSGIRPPAPLLAAKEAATAGGFWLALCFLPQDVQTESGAP
jgi:hypothetical protein